MNHGVVECGRNCFTEPMNWCIHLLVSKLQMVSFPFNYGNIHLSGNIKVMSRVCDVLWYFTISIIWLQHKNIRTYFIRFCRGVCASALFISPYQTYYFLTAQGDSKLSLGHLYKWLIAQERLPLDSRKSLDVMLRAYLRYKAVLYVGCLPRLFMRHFFSSKWEYEMVCEKMWVHERLAT